jgi:hypothetical protein
LALSWARSHSLNARPFWVVIGCLVAPLAKGRGVPRVTQQLSADGWCLPITRSYRFSGTDRSAATTGRVRLKAVQWATTVACWHRPSCSRHQPRGLGHRLRGLGHRLRERARPAAARQALDPAPGTAPSAIPTPRRSGEMA